MLIVVGGAYYLLTKNGSSGTPVQTNTTAETTVPTSSTPATSEVAVSIQNFSFNPSTLSVKTGTKVTWTNNDTVSHTITSDSGGLLNSSTLTPGQSFSFTFTDPGTVSYHCAIHPMMKGTVSIEN